jgi:excinuclease ABC subunit C
MANKYLPQLQVLARNLPEEPGVYLMKNSKNQVIYVGKAKNLPKRVKTYFNPKYPKNTKTLKMVNEVRTFEHLIVTSESEALLLEYNLIKKHQPKYNIRLKNTHGYPYLKIDLNKPYPKLEVVYRTSKQAKVKHFGPYPNIGQVYEVRDFLNKNLKLRTCSEAEFRNRVRPCLLYQMNQCTGPCVFKTDYQSQINHVLGILEGKHSTLKELEKEMDQLSEQELFERAAQYRDLIKFFKQNNSTVAQVKNQDEIYIDYQEQGQTVLVGVLSINQGKVENLHKVILENFEQIPINDFLTGNLLTILQAVTLVPKISVHWALPMDMKKLVEDTLSVTLQTKNHPEYQKLISDNLVIENKLTHEQLEQIQSELGLGKVPYKIECVDISNWQAESPVASKVTMMEGVLDKSEYRKYKMRTKGPNDFAMIKEVVLRRFSKNDLSFPDLLVIDGGAQQLEKALEALNELKVQGVEVVGLAKDKVKNHFSDSEVKSSGERIVKPDGSIIQLTSKMQAYILTRLRDEAHRFAIKFHRQLRSKNTLKTGIKDIEE